MSFPAIVIDTREQRPYQFDHAQIGTLRTGDYSLLGLEDRIAIERKTLIDLYGSLGHGRRRFEAEFERLSDLEYGALIVEANMADLLVAPPRSRMSPRSVIGSVLGWSVKFRIPIFFCGDRRHGQATTRKLLEFFHKYEIVPTTGDKAKGNTPHEAHDLCPR